MIQRGQIYRSAKPTYHFPDGSEHTRIQVISNVHGGIWGASVTVATIRSSDGKLIRQRNLLVSQLHAKPYGKSGNPRKTGWILVSEPSGE